MAEARGTGGAVFPSSSSAAGTPGRQCCADGCGLFPKLTLDQQLRKKDKLNRLRWLDAKGARLTPIAKSWSRCALSGSTSSLGIRCRRGRDLERSIDPPS